jgi:hypothetical protein
MEGDFLGPIRPGDCTRQIVASNDLCTGRNDGERLKNAAPVSEVPDGYESFCSSTMVIPFLSMDA